MSQLELRIPPPLIAAAVAAAMVSAAIWLGPTLPFPAVVRVGAALVLAGAGAALDIAALLSFKRAKTTVNPMLPQSSAHMVRSGVFRFTRNPMYLGLVLILLALALYMASPWALLGPLVFGLYITRFQIVPEERALLERFGAEYAAYCAQVRRWL